MGKVFCQQPADPPAWDEWAMGHSITERFPPLPLPPFPPPRPVRRSARLRSKRGEVRTVPMRNPRRKSPTAAPRVTAQKRPLAARGPAGSVTAPSDVHMTAGLSEQRQRTAPGPLAEAPQPWGRAGGRGRWFPPQPGPPVGVLHTGVGL